ncbi:MAG: hypothetical protein ACK5QT_00850 [Oligoflexia bacterium]
MKAVGARTLKGLVGIFLVFNFCSFRQIHDTLNLSEEDWALELGLRSEGRSSLSSVPSEADEDFWESYNQWLCFDSHEIDLEMVPVEYGGTREVPTLVARDYEHRFEFTLSPEVPRDNEVVLSEWRRLLDGAASVCVFAAYLQSVQPAETQEEDASLWVISGFKTERGYWWD